MSAWTLVLGVVVGLIFGHVLAWSRARRRLDALHVRCDRASSAGAWDAAVPRAAVLVDLNPADRSGVRNLARLDLVDLNRSDLVQLRRVPAFYVAPGDCLTVQLERAPFDVDPIAFVHGVDRGDVASELVTWWDHDTAPHA